MKTYNILRKFLSLLFIISLFLLGLFPVEKSLHAEETLREGLTVIENSESKTGYTAIFAYRNDDAKEVLLNGEFGMVVPGEYDKVYPPENWNNTMDHAPAVPFDQKTLSFPMEKDEESGLWTVRLDLPNGLYRYVYIVDGNATRDPANMPLSNGYYTLGKSPALIGFDPEKQKIDRSFLLPVAEENRGSVHFDLIETKGLVDPSAKQLIEGKQSIGIYLPNDYDEKRAEPYKVLYISQGTGGNEIGWFCFGKLDSIIDHAVQNGTNEGFVVVTMNNTLFQENGNCWTFEKCIDNVMDVIIPYVESTYNVSSDPNDRAFAGLSQGGALTARMYAAHAGDFGYFAVLSGGPDASKYAELDGWETQAEFALTDQEDLDHPVLFLGYGEGDGESIIASMEDFEAKLDEKNIEYRLEKTPTGHDWFCWSDLMQIFVRDVLWKNTFPTETKDYNTTMDIVGVGCVVLMTTAALFAGKRH